MRSSSVLSEKHDPVTASCESRTVVVWMSRPADGFRRETSAACARSSNGPVAPSVGMAAGSTNRPAHRRVERRAQSFDEHVEASRAQNGDSGAGRTDAPRCAADPPSRPTSIATRRRASCSSPCAECSTANHSCRSPVSHCQHGQLGICTLGWVRRSAHVWPPARGGCRRQPLRARCPPEIGGPVVHQAAPTLEEITAGVGRLCRVAHRMGERGFDHLTRRIRLLRRPVPEARPEAMRHGGDAEFLDQL